MKAIDEEIQVTLKEEFTPIRPLIEGLITKHKLKEANLVCWVPHEVASIVQLGHEKGLKEDLQAFLKDTLPAGKYKEHDEPGTQFRYNSYEHLRTKLIGNVSITLIVKDSKLYIGKWQDLFFYSPVFKDIPNQKIFCRILKFA